MQLSDIPAKFNIPFAASAGAGFIRDVPQAPTGTPGQASLTTGFPPENFQPVAAGGVPPFGSDFNGILNKSTAWNRWQGAGVAFPPYDATFQAAVGGYPKSALVSSLVEDLLIYYSLVDNNVTNPDTGGAGWYIWSRKLTVNTTIYVNAATGNDSFNGLTPATAKATIQAAVDTAWTFPPSQFTITIQVANGTYTGGVLTPLFAGPAVIIQGASTAGVIMNSGSNGAFAVQGLNQVTIKNVTAANTSSSGGAGLFSATFSAILTTQDTASNATGGSVFAATDNAVINCGNHTFNGNCLTFWTASTLGVINLVPGASVYTVSSPLTVSLATVISFGAAALSLPSGTHPTFVNPGNVTGKRYDVTLNGVVNTVGAGSTYFPCTIAGTTATGGQYI